ncbi:hypothetical protein [uncultured Pseudokineococcus sp.]|uniref:hypothetical protein n=1 Tax=uncultured Pseudokineococcus sp. TaxID=1642928 RepID=UPI0026156427|nr:hypothetical protein [uncultured Pseudokineococcus sp.]
MAADPTTRAFDRLMGRQSPPLRVERCEVLAERAVGEDEDGTFPAVVARVEGDLVRVVYAVGDGDATLVESTLHLDEARRLVDSSSR